MMAVSQQSSYPTNPEAEKQAKSASPIPAPEPSNEESVNRYIQNCDMESLVNLVMNGRGHELIGKQAKNPEIQEFLNNVPAYIKKIASIHKFAYTGNMRDLQSLLDSRRLAEAQDCAGRGPLHYAVLGNKSQVIGYLVKGYPQCIDMPDIEGRTALHYAAALPDSGVMYKELIQAGADYNLKDKLGNTPEIYLSRKDLLKLDDLINAAVATTGVAQSQQQRRASAKVAVAFVTFCEKYGYFHPNRCRHSHTITVKSDNTDNEIGKR